MQQNQLTIPSTVSKPIPATIPGSQPLFLTIAGSNEQIGQLQLIDSIGQRTNILFLSVKMNEQLDPKLFTFDVPEGADVIQE